MDELKSEVDTLKNQVAELNDKLDELRNLIGKVCHSMSKGFSVVADNQGWMVLRLNGGMATSSGIFMVNYIGWMVLRYLNSKLNENK